jgi:lactate racemase
MQVKIPIGHKFQQIDLPAGQVAGVCMPGTMPHALHPETLVQKAIEGSLQTTGVAEKAARGRPRACVVVTDRTRSTPLGLIAPLLLDQLNALGVPDARITIISGGGMHAADTRSDLMQTLGPAVLERVTTATNEPDNDGIMISLGTTGLGTPVEAHRSYAEGEIKIGVTNVNSCMLAGWSGGGKIVLPGVTSRRTIYHNHKHFVGTLAALRCASLMGVMPPDNLVRADVEEAAAITGVDMVVNTVLDEQRRLVDIYCGAHGASRGSMSAASCGCADLCRG